MPSKKHKELERVSAQSNAMNKAARASCDETERHIISSRGAIARSLELLGRRFGRLDDN